MRNELYEIIEEYITCDKEHDEQFILELITGFYKDEVKSKFGEYDDNNYHDNKP